MGGYILGGIFGGLAIVACIFVIIYFPPWIGR